MAMVKGEITEEKSNKIICNRNILLTIISLATREISGVADMDNRVWSRLRDRFCWNYYDGAFVKFRKDGSVDINVYIVMYANYNVSEIAYKIQENVRSSVTSMLNLKINDINVHVVDVVVNEAQN